MHWRNALHTVKYFVHLKHTKSGENVLYHLKCVMYKIGYISLNVADEIRALPVSKAGEMVGCQ